jgi:hypothetical protein
MQEFGWLFAIQLGMPRKCLRQKKQAKSMVGSLEWGGILTSGCVKEHVVPTPGTEPASQERRRFSCRI